VQFRSGKSRFAMTDKGLFFCGHVGRVDGHKLPVPCVVVGLRDDVEIVAGALRLQSPILYVPPGVPHRLDGHESLIASVFFEPDAEWASTLERELGGDPADLSLYIDRVDLDRLALEAFKTRSASPLLAAAFPAMSKEMVSMDPRVLALLRRIRDQGMGRMSQDAAARHLACSPTTMLKLFRKEARTTFRTYKLWTALRFTLAQYADEKRFGMAALDAGFADASHFTRRFRGVFGVRPRDVFPRV